MSEKKDPKDIWQDGSVVDRRSGVDRRDLQRDGDSGSGLERRRGPGRRLSDFTKAAEEGHVGFGGAMGHRLLEHLAPFIKHFDN